jgi:hypothetical protein
MALSCIDSVFDWTDVVTGLLRPKSSRPDFSAKVSPPPGGGREASMVVLGRMRCGRPGHLDWSPTARNSCCRRLGALWVRERSLDHTQGTLQGCEHPN